MSTVAQYVDPTWIATTMAMPRSTVYEMLARGEFGPDVMNTGSAERPRYRIPLEAFDAWRERRKVRPLTDPMPVPGQRSRGSVRHGVIPLSSKRRVA